MDLEPHKGLNFEMYHIEQKKTYTYISSIEGLDDFVEGYITLSLST